MFKSLLSKLINPKAKPAITVEIGIVDIYGRPVKDALEYFYPKKITGIPVFSVDSIYNHYKPKIKEVYENAGIGDHRTVKGTDVKVLDELFEKVIKNYIEYIHMLPASENHHHSSPGGMIVHSLEASIFAQRYAQEYMPESSGMQDLDREALPIYRYGVWLAAFLHDAGKVLRDVIIDAVDIEVDGVNVAVGNHHLVPSWIPEKESLVRWAKRCHVATYSITYIKDRIHNQHNVDSVQLMRPVIGNGYALDYLLSTTSGVHSKLVRVLAGYDNGKDFISTAVRRGDMLSTSRNVAKSAGNTFLVEQTLSPSSKIYKAMQIARQDWTYNEQNANVFFIGGVAYLRYAKTFHSIINTAKKIGLIIPTDIRTVLTIMEDSGIIEPFDNNHRSVKFKAGTFNDRQINDIRTGKETVQWEELIKIKWKGLIFGEEPIPDSLCGIFWLTESSLILEVNEGGQLKVITPQGEHEHEHEHGEVIQNNHTTQDEVVITEESTSHKSDVIIQKSATSEVKNEAVAIENKTNPPEKVNNINEKLKALVNDKKNKSVKPEKSLVFKNAPKTEVDESSTVKIVNTTTGEIHNVNSPNVIDEGELASILDNGSYSEKLISIPKKKGKYISIENAMSILSISDKRQVIAKLSDMDLLKKLNNKPNITVQKENGKPVQYLEIDEGNMRIFLNIAKSDESLPKDVADNPEPAIKKTHTAVKIDENRKPARKKPVGKKPTTNKTATGKPPIKSTKPDPIPEMKELDPIDSADYGLMMRVSKATEGTLGFYVFEHIKSLGENCNYSDFIIEKDNKTLLNSQSLVDLINKSSSSANYRLRQLIKSMKDSNVEVESVKINDISFLCFNANKINEINLGLV